MSNVRDAGAKTSAVTAVDFSVEPARQALLDLLVENDSALLDDFVLDQDRVTDQRLRQALVDQVGKGLIYPAFAGSAGTGAGVGTLMEAIETLLPGKEADVSGPASGRIFKIDRGWGGEKQAVLALTSGTIHLRQMVDLPNAEERITAIQVYQAGKLEPARSLRAGQIGRIGGLGSAVIGDAVGQNAAYTRQAQFAPPTLETQVQARRTADRQALWAALGQLTEQDPLINLRHDEEAGEIFVSLYGEVQKEVIGTTLEQDFGLAVDFLESTTICAERPIGVGEAAEVAFDGDNPFVATIGLRVEPCPPGSGNSFAFAVNSGLMPAGFYRAVEETVEQALKQGRFGWPIIDCQVTMTAAGQRAPISTAGDFRHLTPLVLASALERAGTTVCEPISQFSLDAPLEAMGTLLTLLGQVGAAVTTTEIEDRTATFKGTMSTGIVQQVQRQLPDLTGGAAAMETVFDHYAPMTAPRRRYRIGPNPFDRKDYLAKLRG